MENSEQNEYIAYGFDMDHCIIRYKHKEQKQLAYRATTKTLVEQHQYDPIIFELKEEELDFPQNFLVIDLIHGNIMKLGPNKKVLRSYHGLRRQTKEEIERQYGADCIFKEFMPEKYTVKSVYACFPTHFDDVNCLIFAKIVEAMPKLNINKSYNDIYVEIYASLNFLYKNFNGEEYLTFSDHGYYYPDIYVNPQKYVYQRDKLKQILLDLRQKGKFIFAVTNAHFEYVNHLQKVAMGDDWESLFDLILVKAQKPYFFKDNNKPFWNVDYSIKSSKGIEYHKLEDVVSGKIFQEGSYQTAEKYIRQQVNSADGKIAYFGDHWVNDAYAASMCGWDGVCVVEELQELETGTFEGSVEYQKYWGDFCTDKDIHDETLEVENFWLQWIRENKLQACSLIENYNF